MNGIYLTNTDIFNDKSEFIRIFSLLPQWRQEEISRIKNEKNRIQSTTVFALAQKVIKTLGITGELKKEPSGKPFISNSEHYISFSHSGSLAAVAICQSPVGLDIEKNRPTLPGAVKIFDSEIRELIKTPEDFMKYWTMYEAHIKLGRHNFLKDECNYLTFYENDYTLSVCTHIPTEFSLHHTLI